MRVIPERELRNDVGRVLREVEAGERLRITVDGRPVADLIPIAGAPRTFVSLEDVTRLLEQAPLDQAFMRDVDAAGGDAIDQRGRSRLKHAQGFDSSGSRFSETELMQ